MEEKNTDRKHFWESASGLLISLLTLLTAIIGCVAAIIGSPQILGFIVPPSSTPIIITPTAVPPKIITSTPIPLENTQPPNLVPTIMVVVVTEIATQPAATTPKMYGFSLCSGTCNGANAIASRIAPERSVRIHAQWYYENIPIGSDYTRTWSMNGQDWVSYRCTWPGPENGTFTITLREPKGLRSGSWVMTITVNGVVLMKEQVDVQGNWDYWDPAGTINDCYGK